MGEFSRVIVSGANGFVGSHLVPALKRQGWDVTAGVRSAGIAVPDANVTMALGELADYTSDMDLRGHDAVVHLAGCVHRMDERSVERGQFMRENHDATMQLALAAAASGVRRFVYLSTVKVNGERTGPDRPFRAEDPPRPVDGYAKSKAAAEESLWAIARETGLGVTVIRPPLVYGPGVGANFLRLMSLANKPVPFPTPFGMPRSLVHVDNLASAIVQVLESPEAVGRTYLVRDGMDVTSGELVARLRLAKSNRTLSVPLPIAWTRALTRTMTGRESGRRLTECLTVDDRPIRRETGWVPPLTLMQGIENTIGLPLRQRRLLLFVTEDWYFWSHRLQLARAAIAAGWDVHLTCNVGDHAERIRDEGITLHPIQLSRRSTNPLSEAGVVRAVHNVIRSARPDVLHNVALKPIALGTLAARGTHTPAVINAVAGMGSAFTVGSSSVTRRGLELLLRHALTAANQWTIVQNSDDRQEVSLRFGAAPGRVILIPGSGVDLSTFTASPPLASSTVTATVVSRMLKDKGIAETVQAVRLLRSTGSPIRLLLVGDTDPENPQAIDRSTLESWDNEDGIDWLGRRDDIAEIWRHSSIAVLASYREGMPLSLLEAAASARPLVTTDAPGCRDLVDDGINGLLAKPRDVLSLRSALDRLASDPELRIRMGTAAREKAERLFSTNAIAEAHLRLYETALGLR